MTQAINASAAVVQTFALTGAIDGDTFAAPSRTRQSGLALVISFDADPGNSEYTLQGSLDDINWVELDNVTGTDDTPIGIEIDPCTFPLLRVNQDSKANAVVTSITAILV